MGRLGAEGVVVVVVGGLNKGVGVPVIAMVSGLVSVLETVGGLWRCR